MLTWKKSAIALGLVGSALLLSLSAASCGGGGAACDAKGSCAKDVAPPQTVIDACNAAKADATCGAKYSDQADCFAGLTVTCDPTTQMSTVPASALTTCKAQIDAYNTCKAGAATDGGTGG